MRPDRSDRTVSLSSFFEVALVVFLGPVERGGGGDLGHDGSTEAAVCLEFLLGCRRRLLLFLVVIEDGRAVLSADVRALAVEGGGVVDLPEDVEELVVGDLG